MIQPWSMPPPQAREICAVEPDGLQTSGRRVQCLPSLLAASGLGDGSDCSVSARGPAQSDPRVQPALLLISEAEFFRNPGRSPSDGSPSPLGPPRRVKVGARESKHSMPVAPNLLSRNFMPRHPTVYGRATSPTSRPAKAGCTWPSCWTCSTARSSPGRSSRG